MDEMKESSLRLTRDKQQPIKTEWSSRYVLFTYFQGDINSVVDEHFSRALSNTKKPKDVSTGDRSEASIPDSDNHLHPNQWSFNPHWTRPMPELSSINKSLANCGLNMPVAQDSSPLMVTSPPPQLGNLWHLSSPVASPSHAEMGYPSPSFSSFHLMPGPERERKYGSLLNLLQQDRCIAYPVPQARKQARHCPHGIGTTNLFPSGTLSPDCEKKSGSFQRLENPSTHPTNGSIETNTVSPPGSESPGHPLEVKGPK
ncbi:transcription cofactor vestigial-like protein 1 [Dromiciops gliroides]|uniref:transcription cofactor vestigial-like protein 1 n=1 Tax=Dromiciops gliroides TaxID=33562 RepID=UPI001CC37614|nr:transcription cofactor vestigial-like protein 1 [Dromiciops gliroides]